MIIQPLGNPYDKNATVTPQTVKTTGTRVIQPLQAPTSYPKPITKQEPVVTKEPSLIEKTKRFISQTANKYVTPGTKATIKSMGENIVSGSKEVVDLINKARVVIQKEIGKVQFVKPAYAPASETTRKETVGGVTADNRDINQLVKEYQASPAFERNKKTNIFIGSVTEGLTGGIIKPETAYKASTTSDKVVEQVGSTIGSLVALKQMGKVFDNFVAGNIKIGNWIVKYPKLAKYLVPIAKSVTTLDLYGQLDPETKNRFAKLATDTLIAVPYALLGNIKSAKVSVPASFGLGFGLAKLSGASDTDAFISGTILGVLDMGGRLGKKGNINKQVADREIRRESLNILKQYSDVKLNEKSSIGDIRKAYIQAVKKYHPDVGGDTNTFKSIASAYEFLTGKTIAPSFYEKPETKTEETITKPKEITTEIAKPKESNIVYTGKPVGELEGVKKADITFYTNNKELSQKYAELNKTVTGKSEVASKDISGLNLKEVTKREMLDAVDNPELKKQFDGVKFIDEKGNWNYAVFEKQPLSTTASKPEVQTVKVVEKKPAKVTTKPSAKVSFTTKQARAIQNVFLDKVNKIASLAETQDDLVNQSTKLIDETILKAKNDTTILAGIRTALSKEMFNFAGTTGQGYKADYANLKTMMDDPESGKYLRLLEDRIEQLDSKLLTKTPSGSAMALYKPEDVPAMSGKLGGIEGIRPVEMPELVRITKELLGGTPSIVKKTGRAAGRFYGKLGDPRIKLVTGLFSKDQQEVKAAERTLAHELGHLIDWLPDYTLKRGNALGRLNTLHSYLKNTFGDDIVTNKEYRQELLKVTRYWHPYDQEKVPEGYRAYRESAKELYADALSVMFNDPGKLQELAPNFYKEFFNKLDNKPQVKEEFFKLQDLLNQGEEAVFKARDEELGKSFDKAEEVYAAKELENRKRSTSLLYQLQTLFDDVNTPIISKVRKAQKLGRQIPAELNPEFALHGFNYTDGKLKNYVADNFQPIFQKAQLVPKGWDQLGKILFYERVINERGELANPQGYNPKTAQSQLDNMEKTMIPEDWKKLQEAKELFRTAVKKSVDLAEKEGFYTPELLEQMKMNPAYATYQVIDYLDTYISAKAYQSIGTLKDIANPATSTVMKLISVQKAIERNKVKRISIEFFKENFPESVENAKTRWNGKFMEVRDPTDPDTGLVITIEDGKPTGYYVDKDVADTLNHTSNKTIQAAARVSRVISQSKFYRPLFTSFNLGFQTFNFVRDFMRYWKNIPDKNIGQALTSFPRAIGRYIQAAPHVAKEVLGIKDNLIKEMENAKVIGLKYNDIFRSEVDQNEKQIERVLEKAGVTSKDRRNKILSPLYFALDSIEKMGNFIERLPKVAGYIEMKGKMPEEQLAEFIRTSVGSPDFRIGGTMTPVSNNIFLFSNAIKEGIKSDARIAYTKNPSRAGFWWKTIMTSVLPKFIMAVIAAGYFGNKLKEQMDKASEYDKTNYNIVPLGEDKNGKAVYMRVPLDETGRFYGGLMWKLLNLTKDDKSIQDIFDIFSFGAGQFPNLSPSFTSAGALLSYLSGNNPYDSFRNRNIIPDREFKAGVKYSFPMLLDWLMKNQGLGIFFPTNLDKYNEDVSQLQRDLNLPVISNILGRWIKVSNYGETERYRKTTEAVQQETSERLLIEREKIDKAIKEYKNSNKTSYEKERIEKQLVKDVIKGLDKEDQKRKETDTIKKYHIGILRGQSDEKVNAIISATSNNQKITLLNNMRKDMNLSEYKKLIALLKKEKIISDAVLKVVR